MKRMVLSLFVLAPLLVLVHAAFSSPVDDMVAANFIFRAGSNLCSATLISAQERWVLTNSHCVEDSVQFVEREEVASDGTVTRRRVAVFDSVTLSQTAYGGGTKVGELTLNAEIVSFSKRVDLAVLRIIAETAQLPKAAKLPTSYKYRLGQEVYAVGNPAGLENTITKGILNHLYREHRWSPDHTAYYIQTDAAIAGGSSGGALYDTDGNLIGVPSAGYRGVAINFAIPIHTIKKFLMENGFERVFDPNAPSREEWLKRKADEQKKK